ncbi:MULTISPECIES: ATP-binding protein [unclassified Methanosarcina]|uniref:ATP-binding protein n=1 Tax=unclassified Methanosarcina TaxID=2644672 RepID=UPI000615C3E4|nr:MULTISPECIES: ATP-binding protein [unclassified Methanosarcina]AKB18355.1 putative ATPase (AAA+ superfamily) [Methanosarcina sp. WWM596]AKB22103.1 putative ATPase (AAA+ superfamily) [Methanosarcina sp. WH1]
MFINRKQELEILKNTLQSPRAEFFVLYGRRRVGKTELMKQILKERADAIYFVGRLEAPYDMLDRLSSITAKKLRDERLARFPFRSVDEAFHYFSEKQELVLILDEFPYMASTESSISSVLQDYWDHKIKSTKSKIFVCGSSIAMMEKQFFNYSSPLYGRRTKQLNLLPLKFLSLKDFFPGSGLKDLIEIYAVFGGTPAYLLEYEGNIFETIKIRILQKEEFLYKDAEFILREELREPRYYFSIIRSIAFGNATSGKIINDTGLSKGVVGKYLQVLQDLDIIERIIPVTESIKSRSGIYKIKDNYFRFYFRFVFPNLEHVELGEQDFVLDKIKSEFPRYLGPAFETIMFEILREHRNLLPMEFEKMGSWWKAGEEIDLVAVNEKADEILFGEVKYTTRKMGFKVLNDLKKKSKKVKWGSENRKEHYLLVSLSGFDEDLIELATAEKITLIDGNQLEKVVFQ